MAVWILAQNVTAVQTLANVQKVDGTGGPNPAAITFDSDNPNKPSFQQSFQVVVTGSGAVSASAQIVGSNDGQNYSTVGGAIAVTSGASPVNASGLANQSFKYWGAYITAIAGTNASATVTLSA